MRIFYFFFLLVTTVTSAEFIGIKEFRKRQQGSCTGDNVPNCKDYGISVCVDPIYKSWVAANCCLYCHNIELTYSIGTTSSSSNQNQGGCVYKGKSYRQAEHWKDGCSYECICANAARGLYTCKQLCFQWKLPSACTLVDPAPGKCCKTPKCPPGYVINYPAGRI